MRGPLGGVRHRAARHEICEGELLARLGPTDHDGASATPRDAKEPDPTGRVYVLRARL
ncbi:MAG TPA: hypothetical protein VFD82_18810 [Planctomycetota bacterium]|nr:hypothetical protein [Planctomycetota bacterium]